MGHVAGMTDIYETSEIVIVPVPCH